MGGVKFKFILSAFKLIWWLLKHFLFFEGFSVYVLQFIFLLNVIQSSKTKAPGMLNELFRHIFLKLNVCWFITILFTCQCTILFMWCLCELKWKPLQKVYHSKHLFPQSFSWFPLESNTPKVKRCNIKISRGVWSPCISLGAVENLKFHFFSKIIRKLQSHHTERFEDLTKPQIPSEVPPPNRLIHFCCRCSNSVASNCIST